MRKMECIKCGADFYGTTALYCPKCRREMEEEKKKKFTYDVFGDSIKSKVKLAELIEKRESFEKKYFADMRCPNYGLMGTDCLGCPDGAFEFKACGRYKGGNNDRN